MSSCLTLSIFVFYWNFLQHLHFLLSIVNVYIFVFAFSLAILTTFKFFFSIYYWLMSIFFKIQFSSVQFSHSFVSDSLRPHGQQHTRPPCPSPTPGVYSNSCPLSQWCHPTISSSVVPFSSCLQSFPASGSFQMRQFFTSGGQNIGVSTSASVLPMNIQDWFPLGWTGWISPYSPRDSQESSPKPQFKNISSSALSFLYSRTLTYTCDYWKNHSFE